MEIYRAAFGLSGDAAADIAGWKQNTDWSNFERAKDGRVPGPEYLARIRERHGVTLDWFYCNSWVGLPDEARTKLEAAEALLAGGKKYRHPKRRAVRVHKRAADVA